VHYEYALSLQILTIFHTKKAPARRGPRNATNLSRVRLFAPSRDYAEAHREAAQREENLRQMRLQLQTTKMVILSAARKTAEGQLLRRHSNVKLAAVPGA